VSRTATKDQIKIAYFKKAKRYHPDADSSEEANWMFQLVAEAYEVLSDDRKRKNFDQFGSAGERWGGRSARGPGRARGPENYDPEELFEKIFGEASEFIILMTLYNRC
jgi:DnaJ family protein A protein 3